MTAQDVIFIHLTDTHLYAVLTPGGFKSPDPQRTAQAVIQHVNAQPFKFDFVLHTGDVVNDPTDPARYAEAAALLATLRAPVHTIPGNHDQREWLRAQFYPRSPTTYHSFEVNGVQFACLDTSVPNKPYGEVGPVQLAWLENICTGGGDQPLVVAMHHHPFKTGSEGMDSLVTVDGLAVHEVLRKAGARLKGVFFGHLHERVTLIRDGITYLSAPSTWFQLLAWPGQTGGFVMDERGLPGYNIVTVGADGRLTVRAISVEV